MRPPTNPDLCYGADAIAEHIGIERRQVYHLHDTGSLPTFKIGWKVCARRSALDAWLAKQEEGAAHAAAES